MSLIDVLITASEKAANIARICRQNHHLFELLIQQKSSEDANPRFVEDFKTFADVLIQEVVKYEIAQHFPGLQNMVKGEENNIFENKLGEQIEVEVKPTLNETTELLQKVLQGDSLAASTLASEVHRIVTPDKTNEEVSENFDTDMESVGVWIDPIDSTSEYINALENCSENGIYTSGLRCALILIGVYNKNSGLPIMGVINQPFFELEEEIWKGKCFWATSTPSNTISGSIPNNVPLKNVVVISSSESDEVKEKLTNAGYSLVEAAGAGYKILAVILGLADIYILSKNTTYKWDTCGPHAILKSLGGDIVTFNNRSEGKTTGIRYSVENSDASNTKIVRCCNSGGIIAYRNPLAFKKLMEFL